VNFKNACFNESVADLVLNRDNFKTIERLPDKLIQKSNPVYMYPESNKGRAHYFSPVKLFLGREFDTKIFNVMVLWFMTFLLYLLLVTKGFKGIKKYLLITIFKFNPDIHKNL